METKGSGSYLVWNKSIPSGLKNFCLRLKKGDILNRAGKMIEENQRI